MYKQIISSTQVNAWTAGTPAVSVGTVQGCSIKLINQTQYELQVFNGTEQIDTVPPFSFIVSPYENDLNVSLDKSNASTVLVSPYQYVAFKRIKGVVSYQTGSTTFPGNTPVAGTVDVGNTTLNVTTAAGDAVTIAGIVDIGNSPAVSISGTPNVNVAAGTVDANITGSIALDSNSTVVNESININPTVYAATNTETLTISANSSYPYFNAFYTPTGKNAYYDEFYVHIYSPGGYINDITLSLNGLYYHNPDMVVANYSPPQPISNKVIEVTTTTDALFGPFYCGSLLIGLFALQLNNTSATAITDTFTAFVYARYASANVINPTTSPIPTQSQYTPTIFNLGSYTFAATVIPAQSVGALQFTGSVSMINVIKAQLLAQQTASSGFVDANPGAGIGFQLQGSIDNSTWYVIAGDANNPTSMDIINNGVWNQAADQTTIPAIISGYAYVRWAIYLFNGTTASVTMSESCTVYMQTLEG